MALFIKLPTKKKPWSSGYRRRLMLCSLWVRIPALYTGWTFFTNICYENWIGVSLKKTENKRKRCQGLHIFLIKRKVFRFKCIRIVLPLMNEKNPWKCLWWDPSFGGMKFFIKLTNKRSFRDLLQISFCQIKSFRGSRTNPEFLDQYCKIFCLQMVT